MQFRDAMKRGLGRCIIELQNAENKDNYRDDVLWGCLHNISFDAQCEGTRGSYVYNLVCLFDDKKWFEKQIIKAFIPYNIDGWWFEHYCKLLYHFATDGSEESREALYNKFEILLSALSKKKEWATDLLDETEWCAVWLTELDGWEAFCYVTNHVGDVLLNCKNPDVILFDYFVDNAIDKFGKNKVEKYFFDKRKTSDAVCEFCKTLEQLEECRKIKNLGREENEKQYLAFEYDENNYLPFTFFWRRLIIKKEASKNDIINLANKLLAEKDSEIRASLLKLFHFTKFPFSENYLFKYAEDNDESVASNALGAMEKVPSKRIREYALELFKNSERQDDAFDLICACYKPTDAPLIIQTVKSLRISYNDKSNWHNIFTRVIDLIENKPKTTRDIHELLLYMYERELCSNCRFDIVKLLKKHKLLADAILNECRFDSNDDMRKWAEKIICKKI